MPRVRHTVAMLDGERRDAGGGRKMEYPMDMRPETYAESIRDQASPQDTGRTHPPDDPRDAGADPDEITEMAGPDGSLLDAMERELVGDLIVELDDPPTPERAEAMEPVDAAAAAEAAPADEGPGEAGPTLAAEAEATACADAAEQTPAEHAGMPLEAVEFELALNAQDIVTSGFEGAVRRAAEMAEGSFLFHMPAHASPDCQRVAAVSLAGPDAPFTLLVLLGGDGRTVKLEDAQASDNPLAGMAVSYGGLLAHLKSLPARAAA
jgi:hypothetical protein